MIIKIRFFIILFCLLFSFQALHAQEKVIDRCKTDLIMQDVYKNEPGYFKAVQNGFKTFAANNSSFKSSVVIIPVHVIIVHPSGQPVGSGDNLSLDHIVSQITVLNEDFRRTNDDASDMPPEFPGDDSEIEFCLASTDPNGNPTDGVTRYVFSGNFDNNEFMIKNATKWPREDYLNIWVAGNIGGLLGYAYIPSTTNLPNPTLDGVVCWTPAFGGPGYATDNVYNLGRTVTHEVGHYLGLNHMWGGGNGGCGQDDGIADTPTQFDKYFGCPTHPSPSCGSNDMFMNYMDYVDDACMNSFTTLQGNYMQLILNTSRSSILNSANTNCTLGPPLGGVVIDQSDLECNGDFSGWIEVEANGGSGVYTYSLNNGPPQSSGLFTDLAAGTYDIFIEDSDGNTFSISTEIFQPDPLVLMNDFVQPASCFGSDDGYIIVSASGGTTDYLYKIGNGDFQASGYFPNLESGNYIVYVQDANLCVKLLVIHVAQPDPIIVYITDQEDVDCFGASNGSVSIDGIGGNGSYMYSFDGGAFGNQTDFSNLEAGEYPVSIVDAKNCMHSMIVSIAEPDELELSVSELNNPSCGGNADGSVVLLGMGGVGPYKYSMDGVTYQGANEFTNLTGGIFTFFIKDAHDCVTSLEVGLVEQGDVEQSILLLEEIQCHGDSNGSFVVHASGGIPDYQYSIDGINFQSDSTFSFLPAGTYEAIVQDQNGCESIMELIIEEPEPLMLDDVEITMEDCDAMNGSLSIVVSGGTGDLAYSLDGANFSDEGIFTGLENGNYQVYVQDFNNCLWSEDFDVNEQSLLQINLLQKNDVLCFGEQSGSINCNVENNFGTAMYSLDGIVYQTSGLFEDLGAGTHTIYTMDEAGCTDQMTFEISQNPVVQLIPGTFTGADCGLENGSAEFTAEGGQSPYSYSLNGMDFFPIGSFAGLNAGIHDLFIKDANDCEYAFNFEIEQLSSLSILTVIKQDPLCFGDENGSIMVNASGGAGELQFSVDGINFFTSNFFNQLGEGAYILTVLDENGCLDEQMINLIEPEQIEMDVQNELHYDCDGNLLGAINYTISGGTEPYTAMLDGNTVESPISADFFNAPGMYTLLVSDDHDCDPLNVQINLEAFIPLVGGIEEIVPDTEGGNGSVHLNASGGAGPFEFSADGSNFSANPIFNNLSAGVYTFFVLDSNGCIDEIEVNILNTAVNNLESVEFKIYPNPFNNQLNIEATEVFDYNTLSIFLYTIDGKELSTSVHLVNNKLLLSGLEKLDSGMYILKLMDKDHQLCKRIIKL